VIREEPWPVRRPCTASYRRFRDALVLHALTLAWSEEQTQQSLRESQAEFPELRGLLEQLRAEVTDRSPGPSGKAEATQSPSTVWAAGAAHPRLTSLIDDTTTSEFLARFETLIRLTQARTLAGLSELDLLEPSRRAGSDTARAIFPEPDPELARDLRGAWSALQVAPLFRPGSLLLLRATRRELDCEVGSPFRLDPLAEVRARAGELTRLHIAWLKGFLEELVPSISIIESPLGSRRDGSGGESSAPHPALKWRLPH
jgi:hypothetical protein